MRDLSNLFGASSGARADVFRLAATLPGEPGPELAESIKKDLRDFLSLLPETAADWNAIRDSLKASLGAAVPSPQQFHDALNRYFRLG